MTKIYEGKIQELFILNNSSVVILGIQCGYSYKGNIFLI